MGRQLFGLRCPACGARNDGYTKAYGPGNPDPEPGCVSLCAYCMVVGIYTDDLQIRRATPEELKEIMADKDFRRIYDALGRSDLPARARERRQG
jgi:hypothetical protein